jgi:hypothetical protein
MGKDMSDREYFKDRARAEREAAQGAEDGPAFHAHMALVREYEWRAATEPYPESASRPSKPEPGSAPP